MKMTEQVRRKRKNNPITFSFFFKDKSADMFRFLYCDKTVSNRYPDISIATTFDFERLAPMPNKVIERRNAMRNLAARGIKEDDYTEEDWENVMGEKVPSSKAWNLSRWGIQDPIDAHVRYSYRKAHDGELYLQFIFTGFVTVPFSMLIELQLLGFEFDFYWLNDLTYEHDDYSTSGNGESVFNANLGLAYDFGAVHKLIYDGDDGTDIGLDQTLVDVHEMMVNARSSLNEFLVKHPLPEWEDNRARLFFIHPPERRQYQIVEKLIRSLETRNYFTREELWEADLAMTTAIKRLYDPDSDRGYIYYSIDNLIRWGLETTVRVLAE